jgi:hypothetical protein
MAPPIQTTLRDIAYATLGAGDVAAERARALTRAPLEFPGQLRDFGNRAPEVVQKRYAELAERGRKVAGRFNRDTAPEPKASTAKPKKAAAPSA